jgi:2-amino-4-hydroxy-6-hydroxymethyldihydropteridine diphosphokinase
VIHRVYLGLGTNLGNRKSNLERACRLLLPEISIVEKSPIYETAPWGYLQQPAFLNQVICAETSLSPKHLLSRVKQLEVDLGRSVTFHLGPRLIDIDILIYDDLNLETPELTIPHPFLSQRAFVLVPLAELAPDLCVPTFNATVAELRARVDQKDILRLVD